MSLAAFQRAMADLAASPALGAAVLQDPEAALGGYDLSEREIRRLAAVSAQPGMKVNRMMYRSNRLTPIRSQLPHTCFVFGPWLRGLLDAFWAENPVLERNAPTEVRRFAAFVRRWLAGREPPVPPVLGEVLAWEMECYELAVLPTGQLLDETAAAAARAGPGSPLRPHPLVGVARFTVDPAYLLEALGQRRPPPYPDAATGEFALLVDYRVRPRALRVLPPPVAEAFVALREGREIAAEMQDALVGRGIAARMG
jgi:hypothetical protein